MIKIDGRILSDLSAASCKEDLYKHLQNAIKLEHATIPPYLTAWYSLQPGVNDGIAGLIRSIALEEMLHMTIAANILVAIGGSPQINDPDFVPKYPGPLPMGIGKDLIVPIEAFSKHLVWRVFRKIEEPEHPIPVQHFLAMGAKGEFATIGQFYTALKEQIRKLGDKIFVVGPTKQVLTWFDSSLLFPIVDVASAVKAIDIVMVQGEGTSSDPFESPGVPAHFYRFEEIYYGKTIVKTATGYAYAGDPIPFDKTAVLPMIDDPDPSDYVPGSQADLLSRSFSSNYSSLLNALHQCFNGSPGNIDTAIGLMYQLRLQALKLMATPVRPGSSRTAGPVFQYVTS